MRTLTANHVLEAAQDVLLDETSDPMAVVWAMQIVAANTPAERSAEQPPPEGSDR